MKKIFLATKNSGKIKELKEIFKDLDGIIIESMADGIEIPDVIEDGSSFEENSKKKAIEIAKFLNCYTVADDSGICAEALNGAPGIYSARYAGKNATDSQNNQKLIEELNDKENKKVKYVAVITVASPEGNTLSFKGEIEGKFLSEARGKNGFGYDPYFYIDEYKVTFGELDPNIKNKISHRAKAMFKLREKIEEQGFENIFKN